MRMKICKAAGCCRLVPMDSGHKYCIEHQSLERAELERRKNYYHKAGHNLWYELYNLPEWKTLRSQKLREQPCCEMCGAPATEVHHMRPHNGDRDLFLDYDNLMSICHSCHVRETQKESIGRRKRTRTADNPLILD